MASKGQPSKSCASSHLAEEKEIRAELQRILVSTEFKSTPRRRRLLNYLVGELLAGREKSLKGYTIATEVFGRDERFDPQADPVVRLEARRLRHDLNSYYVAAGRNDPLRINVPKGQYAPIIEWMDRDQITGSRKPLSTNSLPKHAISVAFFLRALLRRRYLVGGVVLALFGLAATVTVAVWQGQGRGDAEGHGPALAVLPFKADGGGTEQKLFGGGMADEILTSLGRFPDIRLYLPSGNDKVLDDPVEVGRRLGLTYIVDGSVGPNTERSGVVISTRLIEVQTGRIVWTGKYDRSYSAESLQVVRDDIAASVATSLGQTYGIVRTDELHRMAEDSSASVSSYGCVLQSYLYRRSLSLEAYMPALTCLEAAVQRDPGYAEAWAMLGWLEMDAGRFGWATGTRADEAYFRGLETTSKALALDANNISALKARSSIYHYLGNFAESERQQRRALALNPNDPDTMAQLGWRLAVRGRFDEGIPLLKQAIERTVNPPGWYYHLIAIHEYLEGRYSEMLSTAQTATVDGSGLSWSLVAIAEGELGHKEGAKRALANMADISPRLGRNPSEVYRRAQATDSIVQSLMSGLHKAGWQEPIKPQ
ncbi:hypothetical protein [Phyllobacterium sp. UNC302MFCol5.2]|uniref:tetratricopeptide repeat protein n=1 Tax=Phyllobacterium sp. UNC302MFCol5.2 TaxID=1449065 RepID=UPI000691209A|nr:hypothetical protein [Phyllobacterium sp. UNC302MFCol5.2]